MYFVASWRNFEVIENPGANVNLLPGGGVSYSFEYDAWGNHTVTYSNGGGSIVPIVNNPIRYRGYYYDADLSLYYLQTRYYDSNIGRFISSDGYVSTGTGLTGLKCAYCQSF